MLQSKNPGLVFNFTRKPPKRPPPNISPSQKRTSAKITEFVIPTNQLRARSAYTYTLSGPNYRDEITTGPSEGFNALLSKFVDMDKNQNDNEQKDEILGTGINKPTLTNALSAGAKPLKKMAVPPKRRLPPKKALPRRVIIANIRRVKQHNFKPKKHGFATIQASKLWNDKIVNQKPKFYLAIDGLPSSTNIDKHEPEWKKRRGDDILVPFLCFFESDKEYNCLINGTQNKCVRDIAFQKKFAEFSNGIIRLDTAEINFDLGRLLNRIQINCDGYLQEINSNYDRNRLYIASNVDNENKKNIKIHVLSFENGVDRDNWFSEIQSMINRRRDSIQRRNALGNTSSSPASGRYKMKLW